MMDYGINILGMNRITAWPNKKNASSLKVAEKLGFKFEKEISEKLYGKLMDDGTFNANFQIHCG